MLPCGVAHQSGKGAGDAGLVAINPPHGQEA